MLILKTVRKRGKPEDPVKISENIRVLKKYYVTLFIHIVDNVCILKLLQILIMPKESGNSLSLAHDQEFI